MAAPNINSEAERQPRPVSDIPLPDDLLRLCLLPLAAEDRARASAVNKRWRSVALQRPLPRHVTLRVAVSIKRGNPRDVLRRRVRELERELADLSERPFVVQKIERGPAFYEFGRWRLSTYSKFGDLRISGLEPLPPRLKIRLPTNNSQSNRQRLARLRDEALRSLRLLPERALSMEDARRLLARPFYSELTHLSLVLALSCKEMDWGFEFKETGAAGLRTLEIGGLSIGVVGGGAGNEPDLELEPPRFTTPLKFDTSGASFAGIVPACLRRLDLAFPRLVGPDPADELSERKFDWLWEELAPSLLLAQYAPQVR
eukprot:tig00021434_g21365.t1